MIEWFNNLRREEDHGKRRRIYYFDNRDRAGDGSYLGPRLRTAYLAIDEFRPGDDWKSQRDLLRRVVERQLLSHASIVSIRQISYWRVWASIIPSIRPSHWITAGYRSTQNQWDKVPVIQFPVSLGDSEGVVRDLAEPMAWAIDALQVPDSLQLQKSERAVLSLTLLSALSIAVRTRMSQG